MKNHNETLRDLARRMAESPAEIALLFNLLGEEWEIDPPDVDDVRRFYACLSQHGLNFVAAIDSDPDAGACFE